MEERQSKRTSNSFQFSQPSTKKPEVSTNEQAPISFKIETTTNGTSLFNSSKNTKFATFTSSAKKPTKSNNFNQNNLSLFGNQINLNEANLNLSQNPPTFTFGSISSKNSLNNNGGHNFRSTDIEAIKPNFSTNLNNNLQNGGVKSSNGLFNFNNSQTGNSQLSNTSNISYTFGSFKNSSVKDNSANINCVFGNQKETDTKTTNGTFAFGTSQNQTTNAPPLSNPFSTSSSVPSTSFQFASLPTNSDDAKESEIGNGIKAYFRSGDSMYQIPYNTTTSKATEIPISNFNLPTLTKPPQFSNPFALLSKIKKDPISPLNKQLVKEEETKEWKKLINTPTTSLPPLNLEPQYVPLPNTDKEDDFIFYSDRIQTNMLRLKEFDDCSLIDFNPSTAAVNLVKILYLTRLKATMEQKYNNWYSTIEGESNPSSQFNSKSAKDLASISSTS